MKFSLSSLTSGSWAAPSGKAHKALRGTLDVAGATTFWQAHDDDAEHLTLVFRGQAQKPVELAFERDMSIKLYGMSSCDALEAAAHFVAYAQALEERQREPSAPLDDGALWTVFEEVPTCSAEDRAAAFERLRQSLDRFGEVRPGLAPAGAR